MCLSIQALPPAHHGFLRAYVTSASEGLCCFDLFPYRLSQSVSVKMWESLGKRGCNHSLVLKGTHRTVSKPGQSAGLTGRRRQAVARKHAASSVGSRKKRSRAPKGPGSRFAQALNWCFRSTARAERHTGWRERWAGIGSPPRMPPCPMPLSLRASLALTKPPWARHTPLSGSGMMLPHW